MHLGITSGVPETSRTARQIASRTGMLTPTPKWADANRKSPVLGTPLFEGLDDLCHAFTKHELEQDSDNDQPV